MPDHVDVDMKKVILETVVWMLVVSSAVALGWFLCERYRATHALLAEEGDDAQPSATDHPSVNGSVAGQETLPEDAPADRDDLG